VPTLTLTEPLRLFRGGSLPAVTLVYETWGTLSPRKDNVLVLMCGLSASSHARSSPERPEKGWWEAMIGPGRAIDTDRYHVVCCSSFGSCFGSTGPASINPDTGKPWRVDFPVLSIEDIASATHALLKQLGIGTVKAVVGASLGGMTALAYALLYPSQVGRLLSISGTAAANTFVLAMHSISREMVRRDPDWMDGHYPEDRRPTAGLAMARKVGKLGFWGVDEWSDRFGRKRTSSADPVFGYLFEVETFLDFNSRLFVKQFDAATYLYLSRAFDLFDAADHGITLEDALARIEGRVMIIGVTTDLLLPHDQQRLADAFRSAGKPAELLMLDSDKGHDSFLVDIERFDPPIREFLNRD
jgi:homoserine O-acetyltransferase/O-succinyltransferase